MCEPVSIATLAIAAASAIYQADASNKNAKASAKHQQRVHQQNSQLANEAALQAYGALQRRQLEEKAAAAQGIAQVKEQALEASGSARVSAGEAGVSGLSVSTLLDDFARQELEYQGSVARNLEARDVQYGAEYDAIRAQQQGRILSSLPQPVARPDFFGAALRIGADAMSIYGANTSYDANVKGRVWNSNGEAAPF